MCRTFISLIPLVLVLGLVDSASADLVAYWKFDEGAGSTTTDEVGSVVGNVINGEILVS
jgi:hypothetical protein